MKELAGKRQVFPLALAAFMVLFPSLMWLWGKLVAEAGRRPRPDEAVPIVTALMLSAALGIAGKRNRTVARAITLGLGGLVALLVGVAAIGLSKNPFGPWMR